MHLPNSEDSEGGNPAQADAEPEGEVVVLSSLALGLKACEASLVPNGRELPENFGRARHRHAVAAFATETRVGRDASPTSLERRAEEAEPKTVFKAEKHLPTKAFLPASVFSAIATASKPLEVRVLYPMKGFGHDTDEDVESSANAHHDCCAHVRRADKASEDRF